MRRRDIFFIVVIFIFIVNLYYINSTRQPYKKPKGHVHNHKDRHENDDSDEHQTNTDNYTPPYVSIIIPLYNQLHLIIYLDHALESIFSQSFEDYELIIVNDGSTEWGVKTTLENLKNTYPDKRITVVHKTRGGLSDARNAGIKKASAKWILPLDADDLLDSNFLQSAASASKNNPNVNLIISDLVGFEDEPSKVVSRWSVPEWEPSELPKKNLLHCCPFYKKDLWEAAKGYNPVMVFGWEDWEFWLKANKKLPIKPHTLHNTRFFYRVKPGMHSFCTDYNSFCTSILKTVQPSFYSIEEVLHAHQIISNNKQIANQPIQRQITEFCDTTPLHLWKGILLEKEGKTQDAMLDYEQAKRFAARDDWQPALRLALAKKHSGSTQGDEALEDLYSNYKGLKEAVDTVFNHKKES